MSGKMTKFKDLLVDTPNRYTVNGEVKTIVFAPNTITQEGTKDKAEYFNEMQKNGLYNVNATRVVEGTVEFYDVEIEGSDIFDVFDTQFIINFNETNTKLNPVLRFNGNNYYIRMIESFIDVDIEIGTLQKTYIGFLDSANNKLKLFRNEKKLTFDTIEDMKTATWLVEGDVIELLGCYENDGARHYRKIETINKGGIDLGGGKFSNEILNLKVLTLDINSDSINNIDTEKVNFLKLENSDIQINSKISNINRKKKLLKGEYNNTQSKEPDNIYISHMGDCNGKKFSGKINQGSIQIKRKPTVSNPYKIVILGDSISAGNDWSNVGFSNGYIPSSSSGTNNKNHNSIWTEQFAQKLISQVGENFPVKIYNRSLAGLDYNWLPYTFDYAGHPNPTWLVGREQFASNKTWYQCVSDLQPDLVILSMGMNHTEDEHWTAFKAQVYDKFILEPWYKNCSFAIMTTLPPKYDAIDDLDYSVYLYHGAKLAMSQQQRNRCAELLNAYVIDVNRLSVIKRYGFDPKSCVISNKNVAEKVVMQGVDYSLGQWINVLTPDYQSNNLADVRVKQLHPNYVIDFGLKFPSSFLNTANATFRFEPYGKYQKTIIQFASAGNGSGVDIRVYSENISVSKGISVTVVAEQEYFTRIEILPTNINVWFDNLLKVSFKNQISYIPDFKFFADNTVRIRVDRVLAWLPARYEPDTFDIEEFARSSSSLQFGEYTEEYGGGVNHPSTLSVTNSFLPCVDEFIKDFLDSFNNGFLESVCTGMNNQTLIRLGNGGKQLAGYKISANKDVEYFDITFKEPFENVPVVVASSGVDLTDHPSNFFDSVHICQPTTTGVRIYLKSGALGVFRRLQWMAIGK